MAMLQTDRLIAQPRGSYEQAWGFFRTRSGVLRRDHVDLYIKSVYELAPQVGLDPSIIIAQASHETGYFTSYWWNVRLNPAGIGITGDPAQNAASRWFMDGRAAARAHVAHVQLYATGNITAPLSTSDDPRYQAYRDAYGTRKVADTINDFTNRWGIDDNYAVGVVRHGNAIFPNLPASSQTPAPKPPVQSKGPVIMVPWDGNANAVVGGLTYTAKRGTITVNVDELNVRTGTDTASDILRVAKAGETMQTLGWVNGQDVGGEKRWWITTTFERVWVGGTTEKP